MKMKFLLPPERRGLTRSENERYNFGVTKVENLKIDGFPKYFRLVIPEGKSELIIWEENSLNPEHKYNEDTLLGICETLDWQLEDWKEWKKSEKIKKVVFYTPPLSFNRRLTDSRLFLCPTVAVVHDS